MASEKIKSTKLFLHVALTIALVVLLPALGRAQSETVKLGDLAAISNAAVYLAVEKGFFKEQGVTTDITNFASGQNRFLPLLRVSWKFRSAPPARDFLTPSRRKRHFGS